MKLFKTLVLLLLLASGCASVRSTALTEQPGTMFFSKTPDRPYREIAYVETTGNIFTSRAHLLKKLQQQQARLQGDALVQVRQDFVFWWPHAGALVVKYQ